MSLFFNSVHITNFESLKDVTLSDCKRINLLIGKPNVEKSNMLEAIGLFGLNYSCTLDNEILEKLRNDSKTKLSKNDQEFKRLFRDLQKQNAPGSIC